MGSSLPRARWTFHPIMEMEAGGAAWPCRFRTRGNACVHELITPACILHRLLASERRARELKEKAQNELHGQEAAEHSLCSQEK